MSHVAWLVIYCGLILLASLAGGWIPLVLRLTHKRMELAVSFVAGVMLGVGLLHMLPHAITARMDALHAVSDDFAGHEAVHELLGPLLLWVLAGFLAMFLIERFFHFHTHEMPQNNDARDQAEGHDHDHGHKHKLSWSGAAVGLSLHSLIEGLALASSVEALRDGEPVGLAGFATFLVIFLHKPFDSLTLGTLMSVGGHSRAARHAVNIAFSLLIPVGAMLFYMGLKSAGSTDLAVSAALAFSVGTFLCISMSDLLPELQFHQHDRVKLSVALLMGLAVAWGINALEARMHEEIEAAAGGHAIQHLGH